MYQPGGPAVVPGSRFVIIDGDVLACRLLGHRYRFAAEGATMSWACARCGHAGGSKQYASPGEAARYARSFDREDREDLGRRAPLVAGLPLRLLRVWRRRRSAAPGG